jgi:glycosyltransferase involved in cell wall biosynthesis
MINANLSLIMPTRNVQGMVSKILNGISELQWKNIHKLVIIDNGSSDNTISEVLSFITNTTYESKIHLHENGKDLGYGFSINWGLNFLVQDLKNEFIGIIHADDQFSSKALIDLYFS